MKANKTISLEVDLLNRLSKELNASGLIEKLLRAHYGNDLTNHVHDWSNYFTTPGGLARSCQGCGKHELKEK